MIRLSPTTGLNLYDDCKFCFWLHYNKNIQRPRGIFPSLPGGMDLAIKEHFDHYRGDIPPELKGHVDGTLLRDLKLMNKWRNWRTGLRYTDESRDAELFGAMDDCLTQGDIFIPIDYKTRAGAPLDGHSEKYYQTQIDSYAFLLHANGYKTAGHAYLIYYFPEKAKEDGMVKFNIKVVKISVSTDRIKKKFEDAVDFLKGPMPKKGGCEYCSYALKWGKILSENRQLKLF